MWVTLPVNRLLCTLIPDAVDGDVPRNPLASRGERAFARSLR